MIEALEILGIILAGAFVLSALVGAGLVVLFIIAILCDSPPKRRRRKM